MTSWLLHDVCKGLAKNEMISDEFADDDIHRQSVSFSNGGEVQINRGKRLDHGDQVFPPDSFQAKVGENEAGITRREGISSAYAKNLLIPPSPHARSV